VPKQQPQIEPLVYSLDEASSMLGIGKTLTYELIGSGKLPTIMIGRRRLVSRQQLEEFLAELHRSAAETLISTTSASRRRQHQTTNTGDK